VDEHAAIRIAVIAPVVGEDPARTVGRRRVGDVRQELALSGIEMTG
jgi:hypothetical protein